MMEAPKPEEVIAEQPQVDSLFHPSLFFEIGQHLLNKESKFLFLAKERLAESELIRLMRELVMNHFKSKEFQDVMLEALGKHKEEVQAE